MGKIIIILACFCCAVISFVVVLFLSNLYMSMLEGQGGQILASQRLGAKLAPYIATAVFTFFCYTYLKDEK